MPMLDALHSLVVISKSEDANVASTPADGVVARHGDRKQAGDENYLRRRHNRPAIDGEVMWQRPTHSIWH